jgi:hypothetical protein
MTDAIETQVERFAPGFRQRILGRHVFSPAGMETHNPNLVGGDFNGGALDLRQFFLRPTRRLYRTPLSGVFFCGASTPPGGGVHGCAVFMRPNCRLKVSWKRPISKPMDVMSAARRYAHRAKFSGEIRNGLRRHGPTSGFGRPQ